MTPLLNKAIKFEISEMFCFFFQYNMIQFNQTWRFAKINKPLLLVTFFAHVNQLTILNPGKEKKISEKDPVKDAMSALAKCCQKHWCCS